MEVQVTPRDDLLGHEPEDCPCLPQTLPTDGGFIVVHNAWDGRE